MLAHSSNLSVHPLNKGNSKNKLRLSMYFTSSGVDTQNGHTRTHRVNKLICHRFVNSNYIFFFVLITCTKNLVHDITIAGKNNQTLRIFVESSHRKDTLAISDVVNYIVFVRRISCTGNAHRFIEKDVYIIFFCTGLNHNTINPYNIFGTYTVSQYCGLAIDSYIF